MSNSVVSAAFGSQRSSALVHVVRALAVPLSLCLWAPACRANDPTDAAARVPPIAYVSPLPGAAAALPQRVGSWRDSNDLAGRIGGWRAYAREAQSRGSGAAAPDAGVAAPAAAAAPPVAPRAAPAASAAPPHKH